MSNETAHGEFPEEFHRREVPLCIRRRGDCLNKSRLHITRPGYLFQEDHLSFSRRIDAAMWGYFVDNLRNVNGIEGPCHNNTTRVLDAVPTALPEERVSVMHIILFINYPKLSSEDKHIRCLLCCLLGGGGGGRVRFVSFKETAISPSVPTQTCNFDTLHSKVQKAPCFLVIVFV